MTREEHPILMVVEHAKAKGAPKHGFSDEEIKAAESELEQIQKEQTNNGKRKGGK